MLTILKEYDVVVDTINGTVQNQRMIFDQNDYNSSKLNITITHKSEIVNVSGGTVNIAFLKSDKKSVFQECTIVDPAKGKVEVVLSSQTLAAPGLVRAELTIDTGDRTITTSGFYFTVKDSIMDDRTVKSSNEFSILKQVMDAGKVLDEVGIRRVVDSVDKVDDIEGRIDSFTAQLAETETQTKEAKQLALQPISHEIDRNIKVSFLDDDTRASVWSRIKPIFEEENVVGNVCCITSDVGKAASLTANQLIELKNMGWTVMSHTHTHVKLNEVDSETIHYELKTAKDFLDNLGLDGDIIAYPYGSIDDTARDIVRKYHTAGISTTEGYNTFPFDSFKLLRFSGVGESVHTLDNLKSIIDNAPNGSWIIFVQHCNRTEWENQQTLDDLRNLIQYIKTKGIEIVSIKDELMKKGNLVDVGNSKGYFRLGRDGSINSNQIVVKQYDGFVFDVNTSVYDFPQGISVIYKNTNDMSTKGFPLTSAGIITTYNLWSSDYSTASNGYANKQYYYPYNRDRIFMRKWDKTTESWGEWLIINTYSRERKYTVDLGVIPASQVKEVGFSSSTFFPLGATVVASPNGGVLESGLMYNAYIAESGNVKLRVHNTRNVEVTVAPREWVFRTLLPQ